MTNLPMGGNGEGLSHPLPSDDTILTHAGRNPAAYQGLVNPPVFRASTILFPTLTDYEGRSSKRVRYGRRGTPTLHELEDLVSDLEGAAGTVLAPSGVAAISMALMSFVRPGDHILMTDGVYGSARKFCEGPLKRLGVETTYFPPRIGADIAKLATERTRVVWLESPSSQTFELHDVPALLGALADRGIVSIIDDSWSAGLFYKPLAQGVDISVQAGTKYLGGHSDLMLGTIACNSDTIETVRASTGSFGVTIGADDAALALRGMRTLAVRMRSHHENGLAVAHYLEAHPAVRAVLHPGLPSHPDHHLWTRDFTGASGLFGFVLEGGEDGPAARAALEGLVDHRRYFGIGSSWGGYESLLIPTYPQRMRTAEKWAPGGQTMRIHVGLESPADLISDLEQGLARWSAELQSIKPTDTL